MLCSLVAKAWLKAKVSSGDVGGGDAAGSDGESVVGRKK